MSLSMFTWFRIPARLGAAVAFLVVISVAIGGLGLFYMTSINERVGNMYTQELTPIESLDDAKSALYRIRGDVLEHILADRQVTKERLKGEINEQQSRIGRRIAEYRATRLSDEEEQLLAQFETPVTAYLKIVEERILPLSAGDEEAKNQAEILARGEAVELFRPARDAVNKLMDYSLARARTRMVNSEAEYDSATWQILATIGVIVLLGGGVGFALARSISSPIRDMTAAMTRLASGDTAASVPDWTRHDEIGEMAQAVQTFRENLLQRRELEEQLRIREDALRKKQQLETLGQLTGGIAHDFNNLLMIIGGSLELVKATPDRSSDMLDRVIRTLRRGEALTARLLAFAKRQPLDPRAIDTNRIIGDIAEFLKSTLGEGIAIKTDIAEETAAIEVDPGALQDAIINLAINARDARPKGCELVLSTQAVTIEPGETLHAFGADGVSGRYVLITVSDNGPGMSTEVQEKAFEPFFSTKPAGLGSGLGLSMVYGFVTQSKGFLRLDSAPGRGTRVEIYLPETTPLPETHHKADDLSPRARRHGTTVLLVEDDPDVRDTVRSMLEQLTYSTVEAGSFAAATELLQANGQAFDIIFSDVDLGTRETGFDVAEFARRVCPQARILLTSAHLKYTLQEESEMDDQYQFIKKPYSLDTLSRKLKEVLNDQKIREFGT